MGKTGRKGVAFIDKVGKVWYNISIEKGFVMDKVIFNAKMISDDECGQGVIAPLVDDYLNHLTIMSRFLTIREYSNAVVLTSEQYDGKQLMLVLVANSYDYDKTVGIVNGVAAYLKRRVITPNYADMRNETFDCTPYLTRENEEYVIALRNDVVKDALDDDLKYCYCSKNTRKKIVDGEYKVPSRYEIQSNFMNIVRGVTAMPKRRPMNEEDLEQMLTDEEIDIMYSKAPQAFRQKERRTKHRAYVVAFDGEYIDMDELVNHEMTDDELIEEMLKHNIPQSTSTNARQTSMDDFMR